MSVTRAQTGPTGLALESYKDPLGIRFEPLAKASSHLITASGVEDALSYTYNPSPEDPAARDASLLLFSSTLPQFVRAYRSLDTPDSGRWMFEVQVASKPVGARTGLTRMHRMGVLSMIDTIQYQFSDTYPRIEIDSISRNIEYMPQLTTSDGAKSTYSNCFQARFALRSISAGLERIVRRGKHMGWDLKEWNID